MGVAVHTSVGGAGRGRGSGGAPDPQTPWPEHCWVLKAARPRSHRPARGRQVRGAGQRPGAD